MISDGGRALDKTQPRIEALKEKLKNATTRKEAVETIGVEPDRWGDEPVEMPDDTIQKFAYFEGFGLDLWFCEGRVATVVLDDGDYED